MIPSNTKQGQLIFGIFRPFDLILLSSGVAVTLILLLLIPLTSIPATIIHSVNAAGNLSCGVIHFSNLVKCSAIIKQYKKLLDEAKEERDKIRKIITDLQKKISQLEETAKCLPKFYENDDTNYSLFSTDYNTTKVQI